MRLGFLLCASSRRGEGINPSKKPVEENLVPDPLLSYEWLKHIPRRIQSSSLEEAVAVTFLRAGCTMAHQFDLFPDAVVSSESRLAFYRDLLGASHEEADAFEDPEGTLFYCEIFPWVTNENHWPRFHDPNSSLFQILFRAYKALPIIYCELLRAIRQGKVGQWGRAPPEAIVPPPSPVILSPTSSQVPFSTFIMLPLPISIYSAAKFNKCHIQSMCTPAYVETGSWAGYHLMTDHLQGPATFMPPIEGMKFSLHSEQNNLHGVRFIANGGFEDGMGNFSLELNLEEGKGLFELTKVYVYRGDIDLPFQGVITPFGIVATFGQFEPLVARMTHWLWLWKSEWVAENTEV